MSLRTLVRVLLKRVETCRNNDQILMEHVWASRPNANPTTIVRYRAHYQNGLRLFLPTDATVLKRRSRHKR